MDEKRPTDDGLHALEGADAGALGVSPPPEPASPAASVDGSEELVPGATLGDRPLTESKPWFTTLAAESHQAGVGNEPPDAQEGQFPDSDDEALRDDEGA